MSTTSRKRAGWLLGGFAILALVGIWTMEVSSPPPLTNGTVRVFGQVVKEGDYPWHKGMTVRALVVRAGGLTPFAKTKVKVLDPHPAWYVKLGRKAQGLLAGLVNGACDGLDSAWDACHLPGDSPDFSMKAASPSVKATVDLRKPSQDIALSPGDVVMVEEKLITF